MTDRNSQGKFLPGNKAGRGNPMAQRVAKLRARLIETVTPDDIGAIVRVLIEQARAGDITAAREILTRTIGKPIEADLLQRLDDMEHQIKENHYADN